MTWMRSLRIFVRCSGLSLVSHACISAWLVSFLKQSTASGDHLSWLQRWVSAVCILPATSLI